MIMRRDWTTRAVSQRLKNQKPSLRMLQKRRTPQRLMEKVPTVFVLRMRQYWQKQPITGPTAMPECHQQYLCPRPLSRLAEAFKIIYIHPSIRNRNKKLDASPRVNINVGLRAVSLQHLNRRRMRSVPQQHAMLIYNRHNRYNRVCRVQQGFKSQHHPYIPMEAALYFTYKSGIAFFPIIGYLFQYRLIHRRQQIGTFSIKVCGIILLSATIKIAFYLFKYYSKALLAQALLMIAVQLSLLRLCLNVMHKEGHFRDEQGQEVKKESFWRWSNRLNYVYTIAVAAVCIFGLALLVRIYKLTLLGEILGYGATCIETTILLPQLLQNLKQSKVKGVSYTFVLLNTAQDLNEFMFVFVVEPQPMQFVVLNGVQTMADLLLILQIVFYKVWRKVVEELVEEGEGEGQHTKEQNRKEQHGDGKDREGEAVGMESQDIVIDKRALEEEIKVESECRGEEQDEGYSSQQRLEIQPQPACSKREGNQKEQQQEKYQLGDVEEGQVQECIREGTEERELGQEYDLQGNQELPSGEENKVASTVDDQE